MDYPIIFTVEDRETGLDRHFKIGFEGRFIDVEPAGTLPALAPDVRARLEARAGDFQALAAVFPPGSVRFRGFTVFRALDVTDQEVLSSLKRDLIDKESIVSSARFDTLQTRLRTLLRRPDLRLGLTAIEGDRVLELSSGASCEHACLFADSVHHALSDYTGSVYHRASLERKPLFIEDLAAYPDRTAIEQNLLDNGVRSLVVSPLHYQDATIGTLILTSPRPGDLNSLQKPRIEEVLPLFSMAVKRSADELDMRVQAFIKEKCTAIHPVVEWRFRKAVFDGLERTVANVTAPSSEMEAIVFSDVYPLYAIADIRGSSTQRAAGIQADLLAQLALARDVLRAAHDVRPLPILDQLTHRIDTYSAEIGGSLRSGDEMAIIGFLRTEIEARFDHLQSFDTRVRERIEAYRRAVDPRVGAIYAKRRDFDESVTRITEAISAYIDLEEQAAQAMYPHYFEKQQTDGVDYSIYVGGSLLEEGGFDPLYLKNLRLWQLMVACGVAIRAERLKDQLATPLEVTNLILVQHAPLSIRFRFDEKRFDVDGAYNVRYEIIKKRIDKAVIRGTAERLTQPGQVALVYSHPSEAHEWREYIDYLQTLGYLTRDGGRARARGATGRSGPARAARESGHQPRRPEYPGVPRGPPRGRARSRLLTGAVPRGRTRLSAARVHLEVGIALQLADLDERAALGRPRREAGLGAPVGPAPPRARDQLPERLTARPTPQRLAQIEAGLRVEAEVPHAVGGEAAPVAGLAEGLRGRRDDAEDRRRPAAGSARRAPSHPRAMDSIVP